MIRGILLALLAAWPAAAQELPLAALMQRFRAVPERRATFTENRDIPELSLPLVSRGTLQWQAPDQLVKHTTTPIDEALRLRGNTLVFERADQGTRRELNLDQVPELRPMVEAIRATLAGDLASLQQHFSIDYTPYATGRWCMVLVPQSVRVRTVMQRVTLCGADIDVGSIETQANGSISQMYIEPAR